MSTVTEAPAFTLYPYQEEAVQAMEEERGFLLADEMGLGKTVVQMEELRRYTLTHSPTRSLIICPKSVISVWEDHAKKFGFKDVYLHHAPQKAEHLITITNWDQIRINPMYKKVGWHFVVADEAHNAKNRKAKRTRALWTIPARHRRALTGSPIVNRPDELWAILHWLYPERWTSYWKFYEKYVDYEKHPFHQYRIVKGAKNVEDLQEKLSMLMLRRFKRDVLTQLPDKYYEKIQVDLSPRQFAVYEQMRKDMLAWVGKNEDKPLAAKMVIAQLMRLRQIAGGTPDIDEEGNVTIHEPSSKIDALMDVIEGTDRPIVVFSNFRAMVRMVRERCNAGKISCVGLTGETAQSDRSEAIRAFQAGEARVFVGTIRAGGVGVTLTRSSTVVFLDRSWSPADNLQAEDRLHRIGQENAVQVIHIDANRTVDRYVEAKLDWKWSIIKQILGG